MTPDDFIRKWSDTKLRERAAAQEHFIDLCRMLGENTPTEADPEGKTYAFEKGAAKLAGGRGWADVWKRGCFAWEYKSPGGDLDQAHLQLKRYADSLENPPLLIVCDMERIRIHANWTNSVQHQIGFQLKDVWDARIREVLKSAFSEKDVEKLKPDRTREEATREVADEFAELAQKLRDRRAQIAPETDESAFAEEVAHFVNRMVFCMFAEDVGLLQERLFEKLLTYCVDREGRFPRLGEKLFSTMKTGGELDFETLEWFNGGLFEEPKALPLNREEIKLALRTAKKKWADIDPSILGTLFERGLDPGKRSQLGAHYTDRDKIMLIVKPVIVQPLTREWSEKKAEIVKTLDGAKAKSKAAQTKARKQAIQIRDGFLERLANFRVLDPACGSGNFLYLALKALKDIEHKANTEAEALGLPRNFFSHVGPQCVKGIEINPFAAELARVSVWVGEIQWMREHGFEVSRDPILKPLETIECRDALLNPDGTEAEWPAADVIIGNPPFLGGKLLRKILENGNGAHGSKNGEVNRLFAAYEGRVPAEADLVCYWFAKAWSQIETGAALRAGLVSTNSIRGGANRAVLSAIAETGRITEAWSDEPWAQDGAAVRVSLVMFDRGNGNGRRTLDGKPAERINADLTATSDDLTKVARLAENRDVAFMGDTKGGAFDIPGDLARKWLALPLNPNGRSNADVLKPWINGMDVTRRPADKWIIDFGWTMSEADAALYEAPFQYVLEHVQPKRAENRREAYAKYWWRHVEARQGMWAALNASSRYIVTPTVAKHRTFTWRDASVCSDHQLIVTARDDDTTFGILHSRAHELWSLRMCSWLGVGNDPRYTPTTTFETFPFPEGLTPAIPAADYAADPRAVAVADAGRRLNELREKWLNPPDLVRRVPEVVAGLPGRILPIDDKAAAILKKRTLTNLYNERPAWLANAHRDLDAAVAQAYTWPADLPDDTILERLFKLNQARVAK